MFARKRAAASTHKRVIAVLLKGAAIRGYLDAGLLGRTEAIELLTPEGEHRSISTEDVKCVYFVREFSGESDLERKTFLSRPKLDGLWVRLRFRDEDVLEGIVANDLLGLLNSGVQLTPPDLHGNTLRVFVPRSALVEMKVLGVVGAARRAARTPAAARGEPGEPAQTKLFGE